MKTEKLQIGNLEAVFSLNSSGELGLLRVGDVAMGRSGAVREAKARAALANEMERGVWSPPAQRTEINSKVGQIINAMRPNSHENSHEVRRTENTRAAVEAWRANRAAKGSEGSGSGTPGRQDANAIIAALRAAPERTRENTQAAVEAWRAQRAAKTSDIKRDRDDEPVGARECRMPTAQDRIQAMRDAANAPRRNPFERER
ncbi:MAG: hypothetical protein ACYDBH_10980 [Acidobacteriaceae bacterium]